MKTAKKGIEKQLLKEISQNNYEEFLGYKNLNMSDDFTKEEMHGRI